MTMISQIHSDHPPSTAWPHHLLLSHRPPPKPLDLELTIVSAKHLKNVNWRNGDLSPYAIFWLDPDRRLATKSDDSNSTKPVWNERFLIPLPPAATAAVALTLEIFHSKPSDTPKPLVGTLRVPIDDLPNLEDSNAIRTFDLRRPSGRPCGKIRLKLVLRERPLPDYQIAPQPAYYYTTTPPPPPSYGRVLLQPPPPQSPRPFTDRQSSYGGGGGSGGPSAPVDYAQYEQKQRPGKVGPGPGLGLGLGAGLAAGGVAGGLAGLAIDEGSRYEEEKIADRVESDLNARELDDYSEYRHAGY
ncbi:hypothetical protein OSB04_026426 [Centaurea solstitialis]|uniref:C2 domain-containing protein n=1 Tax=Centaurea solstitialis TaxID=347529 RepID=A0AA38SPE8_9ASTR|nr:hypothetical protein OSB04_026426 [Centaurea solstitialis]